MANGGDGRTEGRTDGQTASYRTSALWGRCPKRMDKNEDRQQLGRTAIWTGSNTDGQQYGQTNRMNGQIDIRDRNYGSTDTWTNGHTQKRDVPSKKALSMFLHEENLL